MGVLNFVAPLIIARFYVSVTGGGVDVSSVSAILLARGILSDMAVGLAAGLLAGTVRRKSYVYYSVWALWCLLFSLNAEHIKVNMANMDFSFAALAFKEPFIMGSALSLGNAITSAVVAALSIPVLLWTRKVKRMITGTTSAVLLAVLLVSVALFPTSKALPYWLQMNVLEENARGLASSSVYEPQTRYASDEIMQKFFGHDLSGEPVITYPKSRPNVLVVLVEGVSYSLSRSALMPNFRSLYDESLHYSNYITPQKQTNRGFYSAVCGDYPNFLTTEAKPDYVAVYGPTSDCMPQVLKENGYRTLFMQSAPMGYMQKDLLSEKAGFQEAMGYKYFFSRKYYTASAWGVDDKAFFEHSMEKLKELQSGGEPWFAVLLTVGTHHPYTVPGKAAPTQAEAFAYADEAFGKFMEDIKAAGLLNDTLLIVTSDESAGDSNASGLLRELEASHAPLLVMGPGINGPLSNDGYFTHADIQASVLDYLNIASPGTKGRSVFRSYPAGRDIFFGNVYTQKLYSYSGDGTLYVCNNSLQCDAYTGGNGGLFSAGHNRAQADPVFLSKLRQAAEANELSSRKLRTNYVFRLQDRMYTGRRYLLGDQKVSLKAGEKIVWKYDIEAIDDILVHVYASQVKVDDPSLRADIFSENVKVRAGSRFLFEREFSPDYDVPSIWNKVMVVTSDEGRYRVRDISIEHRKR